MPVRLAAKADLRAHGIEFRDLVDAEARERRRVRGLGDEYVA